MFQMFMCVKFNSVLNREMKVYYVIYVTHQGINIKTNCPNLSNQEKSLWF